MRQLRHHIERIQNSDEATKHFWLYTCSSITMLFILVLWSGYMNLAIPGVAGPGGSRKSEVGSRTARIQAEEHVTQSPTSIFMAGLGAVVNGTGIRLSRDIATVKEFILPSNKTISVDKKMPRLIMNGLDKLPDGILPE
jgi:hypothetical protein